MKSKSLKIDQLNVKSFVTSLSANLADTVKGGQTYDCPPPSYTCPRTQVGCGGSNGCGATVNGITICNITACNA